VDHVVVVVRATEAPPASVNGEQTDEHDQAEDHGRYKPSHSGGMLAIFLHGRLGLKMNGFDMNGQSDESSQ